MDPDSGAVIMAPLNRGDQMPAFPTRARFVAGFVTGAVLAAAATAGAQGGFTRITGGVGLQPGGSAFVMCTNAALTEIRAGVEPVVSAMPITHNGVYQRTAGIRCPA